MKRQFDLYVSGYDADDTKIRLKISHSYRVAGLAERIAKSISECSADLAWAIGLLHDIGRFEQVRRYGTFIDADSVDHAQLGADLLIKEGLLERLWKSEPGTGKEAAHPGKSEPGMGKEAMHSGRSEPGTDSECLPELTEDLRKLIEVSIRNHNAYRVRKGLSEQERLYCDILRDADKIDIFRVLCDTPLEEIYNVSVDDMKTAPVSEEVKKCFLDRTAVLFGKRRTPVDKIVGHICLTFELVYPTSVQIAKEQGYVDKLLSFQSDNEETAQWFKYMRKKMWEEMERR